MPAGEIHIELSVNYADDPKVAALARWPKDARGARDLYVQMICYAKANMTDGRVPVEIVARLAFPDPPKTAERQVKMLADVKLITEHDGYWDIPAYLRRNKSRAEIEELSAIRAESGRRGGKNSGRVRRGEAKLKQVAKDGASGGLNTESETESLTSVVEENVRRSPKPTRDEHRLEDEPRSAPVKLDARRISADYCRTLKVVNVGKVCGIVTSAQRAYADDQIAAALSRLSKRPDLPLTHDVLRTEIETGGRQRLPNGCTLGDDGITRDADGRPIAGPGWEAY